MGLENDDTIAAIATPTGRGGVGIVRVSGPLAATIAREILKGQLPPPRTAVYTTFYSETDDSIDQGLALYFPNPHSFTGDDVLELQGHGGPVVMQWLLSRVIALGARLARPGEFSQRAFLNGKMDLAQAEAVADLIDAATLEAARSALKSLQGAFSKQITELAEAILKLRILVEAAMDFPDEDIDALSKGHIQDQLLELMDAVAVILQQAQQGQILKEGLQVVIVGQPNVGKSSLLNTLTQQDTAIVAPIAGTTRDLIKETIQIDGLPIHIIDTAGIRLNPDAIEEEGIKRAKHQLAQADCILLVQDGTQESASIESELIDTYGEKLKVVLNKADLVEKNAQELKKGLWISAKNQQGISALKQFLKESAGFQGGDNVLMARKRHTDALARALGSLEAASRQWSNDVAPECAAEELKYAHDALGEIVGAVSSDALLGHIFSSFCIGK